MSINTHFTWRVENVNKACRLYNLYGKGTVEEYAAMLADVANKKPTPEVLYETARDILAHSRETTLDVANVMGILDSIAVERYYSIEEVEE